MHSSSIKISTRFGESSSVTKGKNADSTPVCAWGSNTTGHTWLETTGFEMKMRYFYFQSGTSTRSLLLENNYFKERKESKDLDKARKKKKEIQTGLKRTFTTMAETFHQKQTSYCYRNLTRCNFSLVKM